MNENVLLLMVEVFEILKEQEAALDSQFENWNTLTFYGTSYCEVAV